MRIDKINYHCDDCKNVHAVFRSRKKALAAGWAVAKDYTMCYCPDCAPFHRRGNAANKQPCGALPPGFEQLKIDNLG